MVCSTEMIIDLPLNWSVTITVSWSTVLWAIWRKKDLISARLCLPEWSLWYPLLSFWQPNTLRNCCTDPWCFWTPANTATLSRQSQIIWIQAFWCTIFSWWKTCRWGWGRAPIIEGRCICSALRCIFENVEGGKFNGVLFVEKLRQFVVGPHRNDLVFPIHVNLRNWPKIQNWWRISCRWCHHLWVPVTISAFVLFLLPWIFMLPSCRVWGCSILYFRWRTCWRGL